MGPLTHRQVGRPRTDGCPWHPLPVRPRAYSGIIEDIFRALGPEAKVRVLARDESKSERVLANGLAGVHSLKEELVEILFPVAVSGHLQQNRSFADFDWSQAIHREQDSAPCQSRRLCPVTARTRPQGRPPQVTRASGQS